MSITLKTTHYCVLDAVNQSPQKEHHFGAILYEAKNELIRAGWLQYIGGFMYQITEHGLYALKEYCKATFVNDKRREVKNPERSITSVTK